MEARAGGGAELDVQAFNRLFAENFVDVLRYAERRTIDPQIAEDIAADTFALAWEKGEAGADITRPWLFRTAAFKLRDHLKRSVRRRDAEAALTRLAEEPPEALHTIDRLALREGLASLSVREREAILLTYWEQLSADETAYVLGCSPSAVWVALSRGRSRLRAMLAAVPETTGGPDDR
jgi:RNA polymerase sigma factor (sigma-70 family)